MGRKPRTSPPAVADAAADPPGHAADRFRVGEPVRIEAPGKPHHGRVGVIDGYRSPNPELVWVKLLIEGGSDLGPYENQPFYADQLRPVAATRKRRQG